MYKTLSTIYCAAIFVLSSISSASAFDLHNDGFGPGKITKTKYFTVEYDARIDKDDLLQKLNLGPAEQILARQSMGRGSTTNEELGRILDALFMRVMGVLDMNVYSFQGKIKICRNQEELKQIFYNLFKNNNIPDTGYSFYVYELNTIYISQEHFTMEVLGHEMGHAVASNYFVVQPSVKVQEVLAGYIEFQIRKDARRGK